MKGLKLFRVLGIQISLNYTWFIVFGLIVWSLAFGYFPYHYPELSRLAHWVMGFLGAVVGIVSRRDILHLLEIKMEFDQRTSS